MDLWTFITNGLLRNPVRQADDSGNVRLWPRQLLAGGGLDGVDDRSPVEESDKLHYVSPFMPGVILFARVSNANHMASEVPNGLDTVAKSPGYSVGIKLGNCKFLAFTSQL